MKYLIILLFLTSCEFDNNITQGATPTEKPKPTNVYKFYYGDTYIESCKKIIYGINTISLSDCDNYLNRTYYNVTNYWVETK